MTNVRKILIVDDDAELREALVEQLALHEEFQATAVESGTTGVQTARAGQVDLVIMDVGLPDIDGREAVRILRKNGFKAPIIMLTDHDTDSDTILGLESGANDYVTKPFRFAVLLARIRAQLRQHEASEDAVFTIGPYTFRPSSKLLMSPKCSKVRLTEKETAILRYLYRAGQKPVSRETLLQEVWGYNSGVTTHTLETHIYRLRQKVERDAAAPAILVTEAGGYKVVPRAKARDRESYGRRRRHCFLRAGATLGCVGQAGFTHSCNRRGNATPAKRRCAVLCRRARRWRLCHSGGLASAGARYAFRRQRSYSGSWHADRRIGASHQHSLSSHGDCKRA